MKTKNPIKSNQVFLLFESEWVYKDGIYLRVIIPPLTKGVRGIFIRHSFAKFVL